MKKLLWLDDIRDPFTKDWLVQYAPYFSRDSRRNVIWVKSYIEFVKWIKDNGIPDTIAFDHDLGEDEAIKNVKNGMSKKKARKQKKEAANGFECAKWLVNYCMDTNTELPKWVVQSANPVGKDNINGLLNNYKKIKMTDLEKYNKVNNTES